MPQISGPFREVTSPKMVRETVSRTAGLLAHVLDLLPSEEPTTSDDE